MRIGWLVSHSNGAFHLYLHRQEASYPSRALVYGFNVILTVFIIVHEQGTIGGKFSAHKSVSFIITILIQLPNVFRSLIQRRHWQYNSLISFLVNYGWCAPQI